MKKIYAFSFAALAAMAIVGCGSKSEEGLASVNNDRISMKQMLDYMATKQQVNVRDGNGQSVNANLAGRLDFQLLQDMVQRQIVMQMSKDEGVFPSDGDVAKELEYRISRNANYVKSMSQAGIDFNTLKRMITYELAEERLITKGVTVTKDDAEKFIKDNPQQFTDPATSDLLYVLVTSDAKKAIVDKAISSGQSFSLIASQYSDDPNAKANGARFPNRVTSSYPQNMQTMINATQTGKVTGWIQFPEGWARFFVQGKNPAKLRTLNDAEKIAVQRQLALMKGRQGRDIEKALINKVAESQVKIDDPALAEMWKKYTEEVKKRADAQKAGAATSDSTAPATTGGGAAEAPAGN